MEYKEKKPEKHKKEENKMIIVIRISGDVKLKSDIRETLYRLRLRRKYSATILDISNKSIQGMIKVVKNSVAFGEVNKETLSKIVETRGQKIKDSKIKPEEAAENILKGKTLEELGFKPFFRLHPPRKGINSKLHYPKGVLGNNKEDINKLVLRML
jgi:large subunit ribosomal protein L30